MGIDCSGLLQLSYNYTQNSFIPRNSNDQFIYLKDNIVKKNSLRKNDLVFWEGHVGIMKNDNEIIHASSFTMKVMKESLDNTIKRIFDSYGLKPKFLKFVGTHH